MAACVLPSQMTRAAGALAGCCCLSVGRHRPAPALLRPPACLGPLSDRRPFPRSQICNTWAALLGGPKRCSDCESRCPPPIRDGRSTRQRGRPIFAANVGEPYCVSVYYYVVVGVARSLVPRSVGSASLAEFLARSSTLRLDLLVQLLCALRFPGLHPLVGPLVNGAGAAWRCAPRGSHRPPQCRSASCATSRRSWRRWVTRASSRLRTSRCLTSSWSPTRSSGSATGTTRTWRS